MIEGEIYDLVEQGEPTVRVRIVRIVGPRLAVVERCDTGTRLYCADSFLQEVPALVKLAEAADDQCG